MFGKHARLVVFAALIAASIANATEFPVEHKLYVGKDSTEAILTFSHEVQFTSAGRPGSEVARKKINKQLDHLFGPMSFATYKAVPRGNQEITNIRIQQKDGTLWAAGYDYKGTIVLQNGPTSHYDITLPKKPDGIYQAGIVIRGGKKTYPCTDSHYQTEGDFWYFWNPAQPGCPLKEGQDYDVISASVSRIANTVRTYPEYGRLVENGKIEMHVLLGMDDPDHSRNPEESNDVNADNWRHVREALLKSGFSERVWSKSEIYSVIPGSADQPDVREFTKSDRKATLVVRLFFGPSGIDEKSQAFHWFFKDAIEKAALMVYDGHSGLGGHLDLDSIEDTEGFKFAPNQNKYQIYFFDSCTSYTYYNTMYFDRKITAADPKGTKNLDIMTNGLSTYFAVMDSASLSVIKAVDAWANGKATISYQDLAADIDSDNLYGINGDEDNPTSP